MKSIESKHKKYWHLSRGLSELVPKLETIIEAYAGAHVEFVKDVYNEEKENGTRVHQSIQEHPEMFKGNLERMLQELDALKQAQEHCQTMASLLSKEGENVN